MFAVTRRLLLRPGWAEDADGLFRAFADERVVMPLARAPWPYRIDDAHAFLSRVADPLYPDFLITERGDPAARIIGGVGFHGGGDTPELGYWLAPDRWGRGLMTEAAGAAIDAARAWLGYRRVVSGHFVDNPASGRVLEKLGFRPTGKVERRHALARRTNVDCAIWELDEEQGSQGDPAGEARMCIAA